MESHQILYTRYLLYKITLTQLMPHWGKLLYCFYFLLNTNKKRNYLFCKDFRFPISEEFKHFWTRFYFFCKISVCVCVIETFRGKYNYRASAQDFTKFCTWQHHNINWSEVFGESRSKSSALVVLFQDFLG